MNNSLFSKTIVGLLLIAIPSQTIFAANGAVVTPEKKGTVYQLQTTMKRFGVVVKSFARCAATGECQSEHQRKLLAEIGDLSKKLLQLLAVAGVVGAAAFFARKQILSDLGKLEEKINDKQQELDERLQKGYKDAADDVEKRVKVAAKAGKKDALRTYNRKKQELKKEFKEEINELKGEIKSEIATAKKDLRHGYEEAVDDLYSIKIPIAGSLIVPGSKGGVIGLDSKARALKKEAQKQAAEQQAQSQENQNLGVAGLFDSGAAGKKSSNIKQ